MRRFVPQPVARHVRRLVHQAAQMAFGEPRIAVDAEHALLHAVLRLTAALVHADPAPTPGEDGSHLALAHHGVA